jgi:RNA polymerase sigma-70 factor (ECF subfamily)
MTAIRATDPQSLDDLELARLARGGDAAAARVLITRHNQRLYRTAFCILNDRAEAEEAVQEAYLKAFEGLDGFQGLSAFATWLTRITVNEALGRRRSRERRRRGLEHRGVAMIEDYREALMPNAHDGADEALMRRQVAELLEVAIARLPEPFRAVFVLREVNELSVEETAEVLGLAVATVKTRLFRARRRLRADLGPQLKLSLAETFVFAGADCAALTEKVLARLGLN